MEVIKCVVRMSAAHAWSPNPAEIESERKSKQPHVTQIKIFFSVCRANRAYERVSMNEYELHSLLYIEKWNGNFK